MLGGQLFIQVRDRPPQLARILSLGLLDRLGLKRIRLESMVNRGPAGEFANDPQPNLLNTLDLFLRPIIIWRRAVTVALQQ